MDMKKHQVSKEDKRRRFKSEKSGKCSKSSTANEPKTNLL